LFVELLAIAFHSNRNIQDKDNKDDYFIDIINKNSKDY